MAQQPRMDDPHWSGIVGLSAMAGMIAWLFGDIIVDAGDGVSYGISAAVLAVALGAFYKVDRDNAAKTYKRELEEAAAPALGTSSAPGPEPLSLGGRAGGVID